MVRIRKLMPQERLLPVQSRPAFTYGAAERPASGSGPENGVSGNYTGRPGLDGRCSETECETSMPQNGRRPAVRAAVSRYACIFCLVMTVLLVPAPAKARRRTMTMRATAYTGHGRTASGQQVRRGMVAADRPGLPLGTTVHPKNDGHSPGP